MRGNFKFFRNFTYFVPGWGMLAMLCLFLVLGAVIGNLLVLLMGMFCGQDIMLEYGTLVAYPVMFIPPMIYASVVSRSRSINNPGVAVDSSNFSPFNAVALVLMLAMATFALGIVCEPVNDLLPEMPDWLKDTFDRLVTGNFWLSFICVSIFAPFFEEWLCRGMILRSLLARKMRPAVAIALSAFFFAVIHLNPWQAIPAFALGLLFGYVYYKTGSLKLTMWMHFVNNTFALAAGQYLSEYTSFKEMLGNNFWPVFAASVIVTGLVLVGLRKIKVSNPIGNLDTKPSLFEQ